MQFKKESYSEAILFGDYSKVVDALLFFPICN